MVFESRNQKWSRRGAALPAPAFRFVEGFLTCTCGRRGGRTSRRVYHSKESAGCIHESVTVMTLSTSSKVVWPALIFSQPL